MHSVPDRSLGANFACETTPSFEVVLNEKRLGVAQVKKVMYTWAMSNEVKVPWFSFPGGKDA